MKMRLKLKYITKFKIKQKNGILELKRNQEINSRLKKVHKTPEARTLSQLSLI